ncbi:hypothetical protein GCM10007884_50650 [Methylobacterium brachythecii]|uniref:Uncharacterized protein n=1 Tax=Methylobacterium brachythecii TaxID=1176177 RepID=A0ABQ6DFJ7_9HYPH|nr:hypothetical protein GCM10007884_50650 [Methylobacterium brachythecii]
MTYRLIGVALGAYEILLRGETVGNLTRTAGTRLRPVVWRARLTERQAISNHPRPFTRSENDFRTFAAAQAWLGPATTAAKT